MASCICTHMVMFTYLHGLFMQAVPVVSLIPYIWHNVMSNWAKYSATALGSGAAPLLAPERASAVSYRQLNEGSDIQLIL